LRLLVFLLIVGYSFTSVVAFAQNWVREGEGWVREGETDTPAPLRDVPLLPPEVRRQIGVPDPASAVSDDVAEEAIIRLTARLTDSSMPLKEGLVWRIFMPEPDFDNQLPLLAHKEGGSAEFRLLPGKYLIHVAFGLAQMVQQVEIKPGVSHYETMVLEAGGLALDATVADTGEGREATINKNRVRFAIYPADEMGGGHSPIIQGVKPGQVIRLKAGLYHVASTYGRSNAIANANIRVEAGKLTQAVMEHHAAQATLKLVRTQAGEALADTSWTIMNASGDTVHEVANAYVDLVLAEGDYIAYARNKEQNYQREFTVIAGQDMEVEIITTEQNRP